MRRVRRGAERLRGGVDDPGLTGSANPRRGSWDKIPGEVPHAKLLASPVMSMDKAARKRWQATCASPRCEGQRGPSRSDLIRRWVDCNEHNRREHPRLSDPDRRRVRPLTWYVGSNGHPTTALPEDVLGLETSRDRHGRECDCAECNPQR